MVENWDIYLGKFTEGGSGSGNFGHGGRPGEVGGSADGGVSGDSPEVQAAAVAAIMADDNISYDVHEVFTPFAKSEVEDPQHLNINRFVERFKDSPIEYGQGVDERGNVVVEVKGNANSVHYTHNEFEALKTAEINMHNHPDQDTPFSKQDFKHYVHANPERAIVVSPNYVFTMHRPEKGWPKKMERDGAKQVEFKPSGREAWAVWQKFAGAYRNAADDKERSKIWAKARRVNMVRVAKYFGVKYTQEKL